MKRYLLAFAPLALYAASSINTDELLTGKRDVKILSSLTYINIKQKTPITSSIQIQTNQGGNVNVVNTIANVNQDYLNFSLYVRYGLSKRVEIFSNVSGFYQSTTTQGANENGENSFATKSKTDFSSLNMGALVQAKKRRQSSSNFCGGKCRCDG